MDLYMLIPIIFIAFVGSMMSGGSLIVFTALTFLSMPIKTAVGTLKLSITVLGLASAGTYLKGGAVDVKKAPSLVLFSLLGAFLGSQIVISLPEETIRIIVILLLFVGTGASLRGIFKTEFREAPLEYSRLLPVIVGFALGVYQKAPRKPTVFSDGRMSHCDAWYSLVNSNDFSTRNFVPYADTTGKRYRKDGDIRK